MINEMAIRSFLHNEYYRYFKNYLLEEIDKVNKIKICEVNLYDPNKLLAMTVKELTLKKVLSEFSQYEIEG